MGIESSGSNHEAAEKLGYLELHQKVEVQSFMNSMELFGMSSLASHWQQKVALLLLAPQSLRLPEVCTGLQRWAGNDRW